MKPRTLKFRGWDQDRKKMWSPQDLSAHRGCWPWLGLYDFPLMQFTGLQDRNGVDIYEGDILKSTRTGKLYPVRWNHAQASFEANRGICFIFAEDFFRFSIIGNVHENSELLS